MMHISGIFEKIEDKLFAVRIENIGEEELAAKDELDKLLDKWKDVEWLARFFTAFRKDLLKFEPTMRVKDAIKQTIYAVKFRDWYIITGGAIKLTDQMDSRPHLKTELHKLTLVKKFLQENEDADSFVYLDI